MGGVEVKEIRCDEYIDGASLDKDFLMYINEGLIPVTNDMMTWGWFMFLLYVFGDQISTYLDTLEQITNCGISKNLEGSKYGNQEFLDSVFKPSWNTMFPGLSKFQYWWHPAVYLLLGFFGFNELLLLPLTQFIVSIVAMLEYGETFLSVYDRLKNGVADQEETVEAETVEAETVEGETATTDEEPSEEEG